MGFTSSHRLTSTPPGFRLGALSFTNPKGGNASGRDDQRREGCRSEVFRPVPRRWASGPEDLQASPFTLTRCTGLNALRRCPGRDDQRRQRVVVWCLVGCYAVRVKLLMWR